MRIVLAGAFGHLGQDVLCAAVRDGHDVLATDLHATALDPAHVPSLIGPGSWTVQEADLTQPSQVQGLCEGADAVITTVGLTKASPTASCYDIDYQANLNLLNEAERARVKKFLYVSVLKADGDPSVPMLDAKNRFEQELRASGIPYVIFRPTGYFYDIAHVFKPMVKKGKVTLLNPNVQANVIDTSDLANFMLEHLHDTDQAFEVGGTETYTYDQIARFFFAAAGKKPSVRRAPAWLFDILASIARRRNNGKEAVIRFSKWTLTHPMVAEIRYGQKSFKEYVRDCYSTKVGE